MRKLLVVNFSIIFFLVGCGMSEKDKTEISQITCNVIKATRNMDAADAAQRIKEVNSAREQMGEERFLGRDYEIRDAVEHALCVEFVRNDEDYQSVLETKKEEKIVRESEAKRLRTARKREARRLEKVASLKEECSSLVRIRDSFEFQIDRLSGELPTECKHFSEDALLDYLTSFKNDERDSFACRKTERFRVFSNEELIAYREKDFEILKKIFEICRKEFTNRTENFVKEEVEIFSEGIKLHCQKNSEGCHEDWIVEG